jgi:cell division transport system ATP-binding protein
MPRGPDYDKDLIRAGLAVKAAGLTAGYGELVALDDVRFEARAGEVTVISGHAGAGKTSLLRVLRLALAPRAGGLFLFGADAAKLSAPRRAKLRRRIGVMEEQPLFVEHWSAADNVALPLTLAGKARREVDADVADLLGFVGVGAETDTPVASLSAAQRKQVALARALAAKPDLLLADEPAAGFSPQAGGRVLRVLHEMRKLGAAVIIATQDPDLAADMGAPHWRLERGRLALVAYGGEPGV